MSHQTLHHFSPTKKSWQKKLSAIETFHCGMYPKGCFLFNNKIDLNQFIHAMQTTLQQFDFLFCKLQSNKNGVVASYSKEENSIQLEIENTTTSLNEINPLQTLPQKIDSRMLSGVTDNFEDLSMVAFKLTIMSDGFAVGYCINHTFIDQASLFYFFKYLANCYSGNQPLKQPILIDIETLLDTETPINFTDITAFRHYAKQVGLKYISDLNDLYTNTKLQPTNAVYLHLDTVKMNQLKQQTNNVISKNDIMHALLLKIYAEDETLSDDSNMYLGFACNMRKYFGLGEEAIGNILHFPYFDPIKVSMVRTSDIITLAMISRTNIKNISVTAYQQKNYMV